MGTLMRKPDLATVAQTLRLPGGMGRASAQEQMSATSTDAVASNPAIVRAESAQVRDSNSPDDELRQRADSAEARCAELMETLSALREQIDTEKQVARESGHADGAAEGREQVLAESAARATRLDALLDAMHERCADDLKVNEDELVEAVMVATGKMLGKAMATRRGAAAAVRQACRALDKRRELVVRVAPDDFEFLSNDEALVEHLGGKARFESDISVALGGCVVESDGGTLDARLDTQLESLRRVLLRMRDKRADEQAAASSAEANTESKTR